MYTEFRYIAKLIHHRTMSDVCQLFRKIQIHYNIGKTIGDHHLQQLTLTKFLVILLSNHYSLFQQNLIVFVLGTSCSVMIAVAMTGQHYKYMYTIHFFELSNLFIFNEHKKNSNLRNCYSSIISIIVDFDILNYFHKIRISIILCIFSY